MTTTVFNPGPGLVLDADGVVIGRYERAVVDASDPQVQAALADGRLVLADDPEPPAEPPTEQEPGGEQEPAGEPTTSTAANKRGAKPKE